MVANKGFITMVGLSQWWLVKAWRRQELTASE